MAATSKPIREWDRLLLRLPDGMKGVLEDRAAQNCASLNGEVVNLIRRGIEAEKSASAPSA